MMNVFYICGMSVPPVMIKRIVQRLIDQGLYKYKLEDQNNGRRKSGNFNIEIDDSQ